jgi:hypothetical protein
MKDKAKLIVGAVVAMAVVGVATGAGIAAQGDDDRPLRGSDYERATAAALQHVGSGRVTETEVGDDGAAFEVEVRLEDGRQVEVQLNEKFEVLGSEGDDDGRDDVDEGSDDD